MPLNFRQSWRLGEGEDFVVEGDEYDTAFFDKKSKFLHYRPQIVILTSVEFDHADIFRDEAHVKDAFREFVELIPSGGDLVVCASSPGALEVAKSARCRVTTYARPGFPADWTFEPSGPARGGRAELRIVRQGTVIGAIETGLPGDYNLENLLGVHRGRHLHRRAAADAGPGQPAVPGHQAPPGVPGHRQRRHRDRRLRPPPHRRARDPGRPAGPLRPGQAVRLLRAPLGHQPARRSSRPSSPRPWPSPTRWCWRPLYAPEKVPAAERLDIDRLAADLRARDVPARVAPTVEETVAHLADRAGPGDTVVVMSSGDYGGLHDKLLAKLGDPVRPARLPDKHRHQPAAQPGGHQPPPAAPVLALLPGDPRPRRR